MSDRRTALPWGPPPYPEPPPRDRGTSGFTTRAPLAWTSGVVLREQKVVLGGSPWEVTLLPDHVRPFAQKLHTAGRAGITASDQAEQDAAVYLLDRGIADPLPVSDRKVDDVEIVIPVYRDAEPLKKCLASLAPEGLPVTVVDDASPEPHASAIKKVVAAYGARLVVREENGGPGGARNTGFGATTAPFLAFLDADAVAAADWLSRLRPLFDDPLIGAVGPRVRPDIQGESSIELYEETRSELDMGAEPSRVVFGVPVGWLPSASVVVRRSAVTDPPFEPGLRVGEDVDLFWRMEEAGWTVRYVPDVVNHHQVRTSLKDFSARRAMYGSSAAELEHRHPRRLIPARPSLSGIAAIAALSTGRPWAAAGIAGYELARQRRLLDPEISWLVVVEFAARSLWSDGFWMGHLLRRDWWPVGVIVLAVSPKSSLARGVAAAMLWEPVRDHLLAQTRLGSVRSLTLRMLDDASYGTGVIRNAIAKRIPNVVTPRLSFPWWPSRPGNEQNVSNAAE